jgi:hypothetical protein
MYADLFLLSEDGIGMKTRNFSLIFLANSPKVFTDGLRGVLDGFFIFFGELVDEGGVESG